MPENSQPMLTFDLVRVLLFSALALLQAVLLVSGQSVLYLAPRMLPFLYFSTAAFCLLALHGTWNLLGSRPAGGCDCGCGHDLRAGAKTAIIVLFGLVLGAGFFLPHQVLDSRVAEKKGISLHRQTTSPMFGPKPGEDFFPGEHLLFEEIPWDSAQAVDDRAGPGDEQDKLRDELGIWYDRELYTEMAEELLAEDILRISGESFLDAMLIISAYLDDFEGRLVEFSGFVFHDATMAEDELAVARIAITCCLADATVYGLLVRAPGTSLPVNDTWVRVRGRIHKTQFLEDSIPLIIADLLEEIPPPAQPYVYPRLYSRYVFEGGAD